MGGWGGSDLRPPHPTLPTLPTPNPTLPPPDPPPPTPTPPPTPLPTVLPCRPSLTRRLQELDGPGHAHQTRLHTGGGQPHLPAVGEGGGDRGAGGDRRGKERDWEGAGCQGGRARRSGVGRPSVMCPAALVGKARRAAPDRPVSVPTSPPVPHHPTPLQAHAPTPTTLPTHHSHSPPPPSPVLGLVGRCDHVAQQPQQQPAGVRGGGGRRGGGGGGDGARAGRRLRRGWGGGQDEGQAALQLVLLRGGSGEWGRVCIGGLRSGTHTHYRACAHSRFIAL